MRQTTPLRGYSWDSLGVATPVQEASRMKVAVGQMTSTASKLQNFHVRRPTVCCVFVQRWSVTWFLERSTCDLPVYCCSQHVQIETPGVQNALHLRCIHLTRSTYQLGAHPKQVGCCCFCKQCSLSPSELIAPHR